MANGIRRARLDADPTLYLGKGNCRRANSLGFAFWPVNAGTGAHELRQRRAATAISTRYPCPKSQLVPRLFRPNAGSDLANLKTKAELSEDGSYYTVNGTKIWTTLAHIADWIFCLTRTSDTGKKQEGITFLLIPMKQEGIEVKPIITLGGSHSVNMVHLTDVKVPVENRVGEEGKGWGYAKGLLAHERTGLAGISKSLVALDTLRLQAGSVKRGNATLLDDPAYKSKLAELEIDLLATEFTELRSLASAANGAEPGPESSILKLKGTEIQQRFKNSP